MLSSILLAAGSWLALAAHTQAALVNVTIDDTHGDPKTGTQVTYSPSEYWNDGTNCPLCTAHPDVSQAYLGTYHDGTWNPAAPINQTFSTTFNGSALYIYCIIAHSLVSPTGTSDMLFFIDNDIVGHYTLAPSGADPKYSYSVNVYSNTSIPSGQHTITVQNGALGQKSLIMLDYLTYSYDDDLPPGSISKDNSSTHAPRVGVIVGAVVGALGFLLILSLIFFFLRRRRRRFLADTHSGTVVNAFLEPSLTAPSIWEASSQQPSISASTTRYPYPPSSSVSSDPRTTRPGQYGHTRAYPSQEALMTHISPTEYDPYAQTLSPSSSQGGQYTPVYDQRAREEERWNALLNPRQAAQGREKHLPPSPNPSQASSSSAARTYDPYVFPEEEPPTYSDPGYEIVPRGRRGIGPSGLRDR